MVLFLTTLYTLYIFMKLYISILQISFINEQKRKEAILMDAEAYRTSAEYAVAKEKMGMVSAFIEFFLFLFWIGFGLNFLQTTFVYESQALQAIVIVLSFILFNAAVTFPFDIYMKFVIDEKFGFNKSSAGLFIKDTVISLVLTLLFGSAVIWGVYLIISSVALWWLWAFLFIFGVVILINMLFPTVRAMFFDTLSPLEDKELDAKITSLMEQTGFKSSGVFVSDASKRDARLNAYFGGLGSTKRVVLFDTLIKKLTANELLAVLGHELGHFAHKDIYKNIAMVGMMMFILFYLLGNVDPILFNELRISESPSMLMILFLLFMPLIGFIAMPLFGLISRHNEYEADKTGSKLIGANYLADALKKLVAENKSFPKSHPIYIFFYYSHPPVLERLEALESDKNVT